MALRPKTPNQLLLEYQQNPVKWVKEWLGREMTPMQQDVCMAVALNEEVSLKTHHSFGKSFMAAALVLWFLCCHRPSKVISTAPSLKQVAGILWTEIGQLHKNSIRQLPGEPIATKLTLGPDWFAMGLTARSNKPDAFQGFHSPHLLVIADEASGISPQIYTAIKSLGAGEHS